MESVAPKRPRPQEEEVNSEESLSKRQKQPYSQIISLLESEEEESPQDLSTLITTLQNEIITSSDDNTLLAQPLPENSPATIEVASDEKATACTTSPVMRHLLEASDDELGIPNSTAGWDFGGDNNGFISGDSFFNVNEAEDINGFASFCDGLWEFEDETANYYALLQSQLFL